MLGHIGGLHLSDVSGNLNPKVVLVKISEFRVKFARKDTAMPQLLQGQVKASEAGKEINKPKLPAGASVGIYLTPGVLSI